MGSFTTGFDMFKRMHYQMMFDYTPNQRYQGSVAVAGHPNTLPYKYDSFFHIKHQGGINPINEKIKFHPYSNVNMKQVITICGLTLSMVLTDSILRILLSEIGGYCRTY